MSRNALLTVALFSAIVLFGGCVCKEGKMALTPSENTPQGALRKIRWAIENKSDLGYKGCEELLRSCLCEADAARWQQLWQGLSQQQREMFLGGDIQTVRTEGNGAHILLMLGDSQGAVMAVKEGEAWKIRLGAVLDVTDEAEE
jgi:hypothetical protein